MSTDDMTFSLTSVLDFQFPPVIPRLESNGLELKPARTLNQTTSQLGASILALHSQAAKKSAKV